MSEFDRAWLGGPGAVFIAPADTPPPISTNSQGEPVSIDDDGVTTWQRIGTMKGLGDGH